MFRTPLLPIAPVPAPASVKPLQEKPGRRWAHLPRSRLRRLLFLGVYLVFCATLVYAGEKLFWNIYAGVPFGATADIWDQYYPIVRTSGVHDVHPRHSDDRFDVLLLGGSALTVGWGNIESLLADKLREELNDRFRIFNLAFPAHSSRDSVLKYSRLPREQFELVVVYDGFNDVRLNCVPRDQFRDDYTHVAWYRAMQQQFKTGSTKFPNEIVKEMFKTMPLGSIDNAFIDEGRDIKTEKPFLLNIETIVETAAKRGDKVLLLTYAYDVPADYTSERFGQGAMAYGRRPDHGTGLGVDSWGRPANVVAAVDIHNAVLRRITREHSNVLLVDEQELIPKQQNLFLDPCHLTDEGCRQFVDNLWPAVAKRIADWKAARARTAR